MLEKITLYKIEDELIIKNLCLIVQKLYIEQKHKVTIYCENEEYIENIDKVMWSFSKKYFLPHGTYKDPKQERQPIYITNKIENINDSNSLILFTISQKDLMKNIEPIKKKFINLINLILIDNNEDNLYKLVNLLKTSDIKSNNPIKFFIKEDGKNKWNETIVN